MKIKLLALLFIIASGNVYAEAQPIPAAPSFDAKSYVLMDHASGSMLVTHNPHAQADPASLTKIMTAYVVYKALESGDIIMDDQVLISEKAWRSVGSRTFVEVGDRINLEDLMLGLIIQSGNDASIALAEHVAGTEEAFADIMNTQALRLGMKNTQFRNATGLTDVEHFTTAYDVAILSRALIAEYPEEYKRFAQKEYTFNGIKQLNRNKLLWRESAVDGIKTGYTQAAGYCLAASAVRNDMRLISVVMGTSGTKVRTVNSQALLNYGFRNFESKKLHKAGESLVAQRMWNGESKLIQLGLAEDIFVTIPRGQSQDLMVDMSFDEEILAPVDKGDTLGVFKVKFQGEDYLERPLVALDENPKGGWWRRIVDFFLKMFF